MKTYIGECTETCNSAACGYDGGDCTQLCDFNKCTYTSLDDGICNEECRNKKCSFDYCDCFQHDLQTQGLNEISTLEMAVQRI